jgi:hypothetical protein
MLSAPLQSPGQRTPIIKEGRADLRLMTGERWAAFPSPLGFGLWRQAMRKPRNEVLLPPGGFMTQARAMPMQIGSGASVPPAPPPLLPCPCPPPSHSLVFVYCDLVVSSHSIWGMFESDSGFRDQRAAALRSRRVRYGGPPPVLPAGEVMRPVALAAAPGPSRLMAWAAWWPGCLVQPAACGLPSPVSSNSDNTVLTLGWQWQCYAEGSRLLVGNRSCSTGRTRSTGGTLVTLVEEQAAYTCSCARTRY